MCVWCGRRSRCRLPMPSPPSHPSLYEMIFNSGDTKSAVSRLDKATRSRRFSDIFAMTSSLGLCRFCMVGENMHGPSSALPLKRRIRLKYPGLGSQCRTQVAYSRWRNVDVLFRVINCRGDERRFRSHGKHGPLSTPVPPPITTCIMRNTSSCVAGTALRCECRAPSRRDLRKQALSLLYRHEQQQQKSGNKATCFSKTKF